MAPCLLPEGNRLFRPDATHQTTVPLCTRRGRRGNDGRGFPANPPWPHDWNLFDSAMLQDLSWRMQDVPLGPPKHKSVDYSCGVARSWYVRYGARFRFSYLGLPYCGSPCSGPAGFRGGSDSKPQQVVLYPNALLSDRSCGTPSHAAKPVLRSTANQ